MGSPRREASHRRVPGIAAFVSVALLFAGACGSPDADRTLNVAWKFQSGDCVSNGVQTVRVSWGAAGQMPREMSFDCGVGRGKLGEFGASGGQYSITAVGLDAGGVARFAHFGTSLMVSGQGTGGEPVDLLLRPKPADIVVNWRLASGGGCPASVILPYFLTVYRPPAMAGGALNAKVTEAQESCVTRTATLRTVAPGDYVVELDSRAVTPKVKATRPVTVVPGENAFVDFQL